MTIGEYIKQLRNEKNLSQRDLANKAGVGHVEISRLETGTRKKANAMTLKAIAPWLGVPYIDLMQKAGILDEVTEHQGFADNIYVDENGNSIDIVQRAKEMYEKNSKWANTAFKVADANLSENEMNTIIVVVEALLGEFLRQKTE